MSSSEPFLVELAVVLVKQRKLFLAAFALVFAFGVGYQLLAAPTYQYVTLIKLAQNGEGALLETSKGVITTIENQWLPQIGREFNDEWGYATDFGVKVTELGGSFVLLSSIGESSNSEEVDWMHSAIADRVEVSQSALETVARKKLQAQIEIAEQAVDAFQTINASESSGAGLLETLVSLKGRLAGMQSVETRVIAQKKERALGLGLSIRMVLMLLQAFVAAVMVVLFYYFAQRVSNELENRKEQE